MSQGDHEQPGGGDSAPGVREPSLFDSLLPIGLPIGLLSLSFYLFRNDASYGPNQIALIFCALVAAGLAYKTACPWRASGGR